MNGLRQSLKQTWEDARRQPAFTGLYVGGVAIAIAFVMIFAMIYYVKLAPVYPEYNRPGTLYMNYVGYEMTGEPRHTRAPAQPMIYFIAAPVATAPARRA